MCYSDFSFFFYFFFFFFQAEDGIRDHCVTGVQTCALPISSTPSRTWKPPCGARSGSGWPSAPFSAADRKSTRLNSSHTVISYAVFCLKKKNELALEATRVHSAAGAPRPEGLVRRPPYRAPY